MTEQEALKNALTHSSGLEYLNPNDAFSAGFCAALAWLRSQGEPTLYFMQWDDDGEDEWSASPNKTSLESLKASNGIGADVVPLYRTPQPAHDDRECLAAIALLGSAMRRLVIAARTSGGTAGPDDELMAACTQAEDAMSLGAIGRAMSIAPQPTISDGWQLVPVEPTEEMLRSAFCEAGGSYENTKGIYRAMLAAAPEPRE